MVGKFSKLGFSVKCLRGDFFQYSSTTVKTFMFGGWLHTCLFIQAFMGFPSDFLISSVLSHSATHTFTLWWEKSCFCFTFCEVKLCQNMKKSPNILSKIVRSYKVFRFYCWYSKYKRQWSHKFEDQIWKG